MSQADKFAQFASTQNVRQSLRSSSIRGAFYLALGSAGDVVLRLVSVFILARLLVPEHFGLVAMATAITAIAAQISHLGLSAATVQRHEINHRQVTNLFWINVGFGLLLALIICALAPLIAAFYRDPRLLPITLAVSTSFFWGGLSVQHEALLTRRMKQAQSAFIRLGASFIAVGVAILLALNGYGYWALVWQEVVRSFLGAVGVWLCCPWLPGLPYRKESVSGLLRFGVHLTLAQLFYGVVSNVDKLIVGRVFGASTLGMFRQAQQLVMVPIEQLNGPITSVSQPGLSMLQNDPGRYARYYQKMLFLVALGTMPIAAFATVYAGELTAAILGNNWSESAPLFRIFAVAAFIRPALGTAGIVVLTSGRSRRLLILTFTSQLTLVVFLAAGINWGAEGVAMAYVLTAAVLLLPNLLYSFMETPITLQMFFRAIRTPALASILMAGGLVVFRDILPGLTSIASLCSGCVVGAILYLSCSLCLPGGRTELTGLLADVVASLPRWRKPPAESAVPADSSDAGVPKCR